jgi:acetaldehyde dehydrogenase
VSGGMVSYDGQKGEGRLKKLKAAILGTGNIGCDLMVKVMRSDSLQCTLMAGRNFNSPGSVFAAQKGVRVSDQSISAILEDPICCDIVFDATSAAVHRENAPILKRLGKFAIDLTPAKLGVMCVPVINLEDALRQDNVNLITCGGQASLPIARAIADVQKDIAYLEMVSTISSKSAGIGTRDNIDEFTQTTKDALSHFTGVANTKAIIALNPAEPPIHMRTTLYALIDKPDMDRIISSVRAMARRVKRYVPGYDIIVEPVLENGRVTTTVGVTGLGDYLPKYSGNLDIITCAAVEIAEQYAKRRVAAAIEG